MWEILSLDGKGRRLFGRPKSCHLRDTVVSADGLGITDVKPTRLMEMVVL